MGVFSYGKKISKVVDIKESAMSADSQVVDTLKFQSILVPNSRQFTFIPKYIKYFDSYENMTGKPYFKDVYWPIVQLKKKRRSPAANGEHDERKILDVCNIPGQHREESSMERKIVQHSS